MNLYLMEYNIVSKKPTIDPMLKGRMWESVLFIYYSPLLLLAVVAAECGFGFLFFSNVVAVSVHTDRNCGLLNVTTADAFNITLGFS